MFSAGSSAGEEESAPRNNTDEKGRFRLGNTVGFRPGNRGRPKGSRHKVTVLCEKLMRDDATEIVRAVIAAARSGDMTACKIVLDRIAPVRKGRPIRFNLPDSRNAEDVAAALEAVVGAMANGELTPDEAQMVANVLEIRRRAIETVDLENRLRVLESMTDGQHSFEGGG
jgi:hypothetical protein